MDRGGGGDRHLELRAPWDADDFRDMCTGEELDDSGDEETLWNSR